MRNLLFTWWFIIGWTFAQLAITDHVYNVEHSKDSVCEWCISHGKKLDAQLASNEMSLNSIPQARPLRAYASPYAEQFEYHTPFTRAPPYF